MKDGVEDQGKSCGLVDSVKMGNNYAIKSEKEIQAGFLEVWQGKMCLLVQYWCDCYGVTNCIPIDPQEGGHT